MIFGIRLMELANGNSKSIKQERQKEERATKDIIQEKFLKKKGRYGIF